jgi:voltage-dependent calcium channel L type alpha-1D
MLIKLVGLGPKIYIKDTFNLFDCLIVLLSTVELVISWAGLKLTGGAISALRSLRILRIFKLARSWTSFRNLLGKIVTSIKDIGNFSILMCLFMFIYTLLGMELYAYKI